MVITLTKGAFLQLHVCDEDLLFSIFGTRKRVSGHFTPKAFHPSDISSHGHFTPRTFHPTF